MLLKIGARRSDLARLQAYTVGAALREANPSLQIEYFFKESLGDKNLHDPLWKMPERGVFTEDFLEDLRSERVDCVVHSWKDLPTEVRPDTQIIATLKRADRRDLILFRRDRLPKEFPNFSPQQQWQMPRLHVLSSSPRREYNLGAFLSDYLPFKIEQLQFAPVRGNILTRVQKLFREDADALVVAKAALDRLLSAQEPEFQSMQSELRSLLAQTTFMVTPITHNPPAAAQGALAIECLKSRSDLPTLFAPIHCTNTFYEAETERAVLRSYGGGCHQKIGIAALTTPHGEYRVTRGEIGQATHQLEWRGRCLWSQHSVAAEQIWPETANNNLFEREALAAENPGSHLFAAKAEALPTWRLDCEQILWTSGLNSWRRLAQRGHWVHGSEESLGEAFPVLPFAAQKNWTKLTHSDAVALSKSPALATYRLLPLALPNLSKKTHFFWSSASAFWEVRKHYPEILQKKHACGLGNTYELLRAEISDLQAFLSYKDWYQFLCKP